VEQDGIAATATWLTRNGIGWSWATLARLPLSGLRTPYSVVAEMLTVPANPACLWERPSGITGSRNSS
jgi:hypothetical protein